MCCSMYVGRLGEEAVWHRGARARRCIWVWVGGCACEGLCACVKTLDRGCQQQPFMPPPFLYVHYLPPPPPPSSLTPQGAEMASRFDLSTLEACMGGCLQAGLFELEDYRRRMMVRLLPLL